MDITEGTTIKESTARGSSICLCALHFQKNIKEQHLLIAVEDVVLNGIKLPSYTVEIYQTPKKKKWWNIKKGASK